MGYNHKEVDKKWQQKWDEQKLYEVDENSEKETYYCLDMFPYPSGAGLHVGHPEGYTATDIVSRFKRMNGYEVMHPMGWDSFGLPAENYAIKTGVHPKQSIAKNIQTFKRQIKSIGLSYDWSREFATSDPSYYKWTQWLFTLLYKNGLAYRKNAQVNWCDSCKTVLANEQVINGACERCKNEVVIKDLEQWFFRTTKYAEQLLTDLDELDWPEKLKTMQRNWIGKSEGAEIDFQIESLDTEITVFTTRPDTLFGVTYMVLAPEHELVKKIADSIKNKREVEEYIEQSVRKTEIERKDDTQEKTGVQLSGVFAINPANNERIPVFIADYVLKDYGTGAIMAVPAHDERDYAFAQKFNLEIKEVVSGGDVSVQAFSGEGELINSGKFNGMGSAEARKKITEAVNGKQTVTYKLRDWLISRQRYWGAPIPVVYCEDCGPVLVPEDELPVMLPDDVDFKPSGESPLAKSKDFQTKNPCPGCGDHEKLRREVDTMDTFVCSSWYYFRYLDPQNEQEFCSKEKMQKWMPIDLYVGGAEHAVGHLIYSRFITKVLYDLGYISFNEPFTRVVNQGLILAEDGRKMSKSLGNVVNPDEVVAEYGADTLRLYEMFMGPLEDSKPWDTKGIRGVRRFLEKVDRIVDYQQFGNDSDSEIERLLHKTIKKVTQDIGELKFNTAISSMMVLASAMQKRKKRSRKHVEVFVTLLAPFAPHLADELWERLGFEKSVHLSQWPTYDEALTVEDEIEIAVQVNGKVRDKISISPNEEEGLVKERALSIDSIKKHLEGKELVKVIYIPGKILSLVTS